MKRLLFFLIGITIQFFSFSQAEVKQQGDTVKIVKRGGGTAYLDVIGVLKIPTPPSGSSTDSIVTWDPVTKQFKKISRTSLLTHTHPIFQIVGLPDTLINIQNRIEAKLNIDEAASTYMPIIRAIDSLAAIQARIQSKEPLLGFTPVPNTRTINGYALTSNVTLNKSDVGLGNVDNTSDVNKPISTATQTALDGKQNTIGYTPENVANKATDFSTINDTKYPTVAAVNTAINSAVSGVYIPLSQKGANNGVAPLDAGGKVDFAYLPATLMIYKGTWNPNTNSPTLANGSGTSGWVYEATWSGGLDSAIINLGGGNITFYKGDHAIYNGSTWQRSVGTNRVNSVNGQQGVVTLTTANISESGNLYYTDGRVQIYGDGRYPQLSGSYSNPSWITSLAWSKITGAPSFLTSETDPVYTASSWFSTTNNASNWNTAYSWGNHASAGYATASRTITINGTTYDLTANRSWSVGTITGTGTSGNFAGWNSSGDIGNAPMTHSGGHIFTTGQFNADGQGRFKGWYASGVGSGLALEIGISGGAGNVIAYNRTSSLYADLYLGGISVILSLQGGTFQVNGSSEFSSDISAAGVSSTISSNSLVNTLSTWNGNTGGSAQNRFRMGNSASLNAFTIDVNGGGHSTAPNVVGIYNQTNANLNLGGWGTTALTLGSGGAVTASSSVTATSGIYTTTGSSALLVGTSTNPGSYNVYFASTFGVSGLVTMGNSLNVTGTATASSFTGAGTGLTGTASGLTAGNSTGWNTEQYANASAGANLLYMMGLNSSTSKWTYYTAANVQAWLGLGTAAYRAANQDLNTSSSPTFATIYATGDVIAYYTSDRRLKKNIKPIENALDKLSMLSGNEYDWDEDIQSAYKGHDYGVIAQEIESVLPGTTHLKPDGFFGIKNQNQIIALLIQAVKELKNEVELLKK